MDKLDKPLGDLKRASFTFEVEQRTGKEVLDVNKVSVGYEPSRPLLRDISFQLKRGETSALIGPNGIGKSTLLKALIGELQLSGGTFTWGANVKIGYYDQEQKGLNPNNTVLNELWNAYPNLEEARIRTVLGSFLFSGDDVFKKVSALSGGERARVSLAKLMLLKANVLILDEPTNHLDLFSKEVLESALMDYEGTLLFISHDRYFLNKMAEHMLELRPDGVTAYLGNYDEYIEKKQELEELKRLELEQKAAAGKSSGGTGHLSAAGSTAAQVNDYEADKAAKREERSRQRKIEQLEQDIARLEEEASAIEEELAKPEVFGDFVQVQEKSALLEQKKAELAACYEQWETLLG
jgi:ATP-binding cassette subfamily F protein 3